MTTTPTIDDAVSDVDVTALMAMLSGNSEYLLTKKKVSKTDKLISEHDGDADPKGLGKLQRARTKYQNQVDAMEETAIEQVRREQKQQQKQKQIQKQGGESLDEASKRSMHRKIRKVDKLMQEIIDEEGNEGAKKSKEYIKLQKKRSRYLSDLEGIQNLSTDSQHRDADGDDDGDDGDEGGMGGPSQHSRHERLRTAQTENNPAVVIETLEKKIEKVSTVLEDMLEEQGEESATSSKEYRKLYRKRKQYLEELEEFYQMLEEAGRLASPNGNEDEDDEEDDDDEPEFHDADGLEDVIEGSNEDDDDREEDEIEKVSGEVSATAPVSPSPPSPTPPPGASNEVLEEYDMPLPGVDQKLSAEDENQTSRKPLERQLSLGQFSIDTRCLDDDDNLLLKNTDRASRQQPKNERQKRVTFDGASVISTLEKKVRKVEKLLHNIVVENGDGEAAKDTKGYKKLERKRQQYLEELEEYRKYMLEGGSGVVESSEVADVPEHEVLDEAGQTGEMELAVEDLQKTNVATKLDDTATTANSSELGLMGDSQHSLGAFSVDTRCCLKDDDDELLEKKESNAEDRAAKASSPDFIQSVITTLEKKVKKVNRLMDKIITDKGSVAAKKSKDYKRLAKKNSQYLDELEEYRQQLADIQNVETTNNHEFQEEEGAEEGAAEDEGEEDEQANNRRRRFSDFSQLSVMSIDTRCLDDDDDDGLVLKEKAPHPRMNRAEKVASSDDNTASVIRVLKKKVRKVERLLKRLDRKKKHSKPVNEEDYARLQKKRDQYLEELDEYYDYQYSGHPEDDNVDDEDTNNNDDVGNVEVEHAQPEDGTATGKRSSAASGLLSIDTLSTEDEELALLQRQQHPAAEAESENVQLLRRKLKKVEKLMRELVEADGESSKAYKKLVKKYDQYVKELEEEGVPPFLDASSQDDGNSNDDTRINPNEQVEMDLTALESEGKKSSHKSSYPASVTSYTSGDMNYSIATIDIEASAADSNEDDEEDTEEMKVIRKKLKKVEKMLRGIVNEKYDGNIELASQQSKEYRGLSRKRIAYARELGIDESQLTPIIGTNNNGKQQQQNNGMCQNE